MKTDKAVNTPTTCGECMPKWDRSLNFKAAILCDFHKAAPETAAERDRLKEVNADLLAALKEVKAWSGRAFPAGRTQPSFLPMIEASILRAEGK